MFGLLFFLIAAFSVWSTDQLFLSLSAEQPQKHSHRGGKTAREGVPERSPWQGTGCFALRPAGRRSLRGGYAAILMQGLVVAIAANEVQRAVTQDDIDGLNHLYSGTNAVPTLNASTTGTEDTFGPGDLDFAESGTAMTGGLGGAEFDIFAADLGAFGILGVTMIFGGSRSGGGLGFGGTPLGGFFDGIPNDLHGFSLDNANHGNLLTTIDIIFNTNPTAMLGVNPNPEPGTLIFCSVAALGLIGRSWRQRQRLREPLSYPTTEVVSRFRSAFSE